MKTEQKDKIYSSILLLLSCGFILYKLNSLSFANPIPNGTILEYLMYAIDTYFDMLIIGYVFFCLQIAGYFGLKYKKDYITISLLTISLTPISLLFFRKEK